MKYHRYAAGHNYIAFKAFKPEPEKPQWLCVSLLRAGRVAQMIPTIKIVTKLAMEKTAIVDLLFCPRGDANSISHSGYAWLFDVRQLKVSAAAHDTIAASIL
jgi:hypothetical protein